MAMVPHERSLVTQMEGKPFVLLGVDIDKTKVDEKGVETDKKMTWRSWHDGASGPIAKEWHVQGWPTLVIVDTNGVIRKKVLGAPDKDDKGRDPLEMAIDKLVSEVQSKHASTENSQK